MFVVAGYDKSSAWISFHEKDENGNWKVLMSTPGLDGIGQASEEVCCTPQGVYGFNCAFGIADDPGCSMPYYKADDNTYWSSDDREGMRYLMKHVKSDCVVVIDKMDALGAEF